MLEAFCDALGLAELDLVANDTGGAFAQGLAVRAPNRIRTLTLTNCEARDWMPSQHELGQLVKSLAEQGQLAPVLTANYDDRDAARGTAFASTFQWPDRPSDDDVRALMEPHQASPEAARELERFAASLLAARHDPGNDRGRGGRGRPAVLALRARRRARAAPEAALG